MLRHLRTRSGFTLVELLVVVAIIGVLATAGIPQYRRMVAKSKQSQAKTMLGQISSAEQAFYSEYGGYGNNLKGMGVQGDTSTAAAPNPNVIYNAGFGLANCASPNAANLVPVNNLANNNVSAAVVNSNQAYFANISVALDATNNFMLGRMTRNANCAAAVSPAIVGAQIYQTFTAVANGSIMPGQNLDNGVADTWSTNQTRVINNVASGIQ